MASPPGARAPVRRLYRPAPPPRRPSGGGPGVSSPSFPIRDPPRPPSRRRGAHLPRRERGRRPVGRRAGAGALQPGVRRGGGDPAGRRAVAAARGASRGADRMGARARRGAGADRRARVAGAPAALPPGPPGLRASVRDGPLPLARRQRGVHPQPARRQLLRHGRDGVGRAAVARAAPLPPRGGSGLEPALRGRALARGRAARCGLGNPLGLGVPGGAAAFPGAPAARARAVSESGARPGRWREPSPRGEPPTRRTCAPGRGASRRRRGPAGALRRRGAT